MEMRPAQLTGTVDQRGTRKRLLSHLGVAARSGDGSTGEANWQFHQKIRRAARSPRLMTQIKQAARVVPSNFLTLFPKHEKHSSPAHVLDAGRSPVDRLEQRGTAQTRNCNYCFIFRRVGCVVSVSRP
jgi:DNA-binding GntR family transcriptional regulator